LSPSFADTRPSRAPNSALSVTIPVAPLSRDSKFGLNIEFYRFLTHFSPFLPIFVLVICLRQHSGGLLLRQIFSGKAKNIDIRAFLFQPGIWAEHSPPRPSNNTKFLFFFFLKLRRKQLPCETILPAEKADESEWKHAEKGVKAG
jgi:hypothetical protein